MTPRASEGGGSTGLSPSRPLTISKQPPLPTPPSSQSPPDMTELHDKELPDPPNESTGEREGGKGGILSGEDATIPRTSPPLPSNPNEVEIVAEPTELTPTSPSKPQSFNDSTSDQPTSNFTHLASDAIPADFLDSALASQADQLYPEAAYPSPASTFRPPPAAEGDTSLVEKLDERISRAKERTRPPKLDTAFSFSHPTPTKTNSDSSLPTPTSPALAPRPSSRPPSRPPSLSRRQSEYRTRSPSTNSHHSPRLDPKRLSVSSSTNGSSLTSPRLADGEYFDGHYSKMPPSPLGPSRRASSHKVPTLPPSPSISNSATPTSPRPPTSSLANEINPWDVPVTIRDWAYPAADPRHLGLPHPDGPDKSGKFRKGSNRTSRQRERDEEEEEEERRQGLGLGSPIDGNQANGSFSWGFVTSHSTDFPASSPASSSVGDGPSGYTFHDSDFDRHSYYSNGQHEEEIEEELGLGEFVPGVYQAVYEFVPELETEMKLSVGEWVSVFERQCAGWVQAGRIVDGVLTEEVGLVPENYLHRLDFEEGAGEGELVDGGDKEETTKGAGSSLESTPVKSSGGDSTDETEQDRRREEKETTPTAAGANT